MVSVEEADALELKIAKVHFFKYSISMCIIKFLHSD